jgi:hypothetical protein
MAPPTRVPGYDPVRFLGRGAFGEVWVCQERNTGRVVAVKFCTQRRGEDWLHLNREVEKLAYLSADRYVVQLVSVSPDSRPPYYIMEYIEEGSLQDRLEDGPLDVDTAVTLFREVAIGLVHLHGKGVLHCDLKPANVLLDRDVKPRLCDFGQARLSDEQVNSLGTLFYMAPEQADEKGVPDARWDVYALGALMYCMLTGNPPHCTPENERKLEEATGLEARLACYRQILQQSPPLNLAKAAPNVDRPLAEIVERCLATDPAHRHANVQVVLDALDDRARRRARRPFVALGVLGPLMLLLAIAVLSYRSFDKAVAKSADALRERALERNRSTAWYVAETVGQVVHDRWHVLHREAANDEIITALQKLQTGDPVQRRPAQQALQQAVDAMAQRHVAIPARSWFITDRQGVQLARAPYKEETIGQSFRYRDYFHGLGRDLPEAEAAELQPSPLSRPHVSVPFVSAITDKAHIVAFSVPIVDAAGSPPLGVLAVTFHVRKISVIERSDASSELITAVFDVRPDSNDQKRVNLKGALLDHPCLRVESAGGEAAPGAPKDRVYLDAARTQEFERLCRTPPGAAPKSTSLVISRYQDPVGRHVPQYNGPYLAAAASVVVAPPSGPPQETGWVVVVQEREEAALQPVADLQNTLLFDAAEALVVLIVLVGGLWAFVGLLLRGPSRWKLLAQLRRRAGLTEASETARSARSNRRALKTVPKAKEGTSGDSKAAP